MRDSVGVVEVEVGFEVGSSRFEVKVEVCQGCVWVVVDVDVGF